MDVDPQLVRQATPGIIGAGAAVLFIKGPWPWRLGMVIPGAVLSYYGAAHLAGVVHMPEGLAGFLLGLFGMAAVAKVFDTWETLQLGSLVQRFLAKRLGLGDGGEKP